VSGDNGPTRVSGDLALRTARRVLLDDDGDSYVHCEANDDCSVVVGGLGYLRLNGSWIYMMRRTRMEAAGFRPSPLASNPCAGSSYPEGALLYNSTAGYQCFCGAGSTAKQVHSPATDCF